MLQNVAILILVAGVSRLYLLITYFLRYRKVACISAYYINNYFSTIWAVLLKTYVISLFAYIYNS